MAAVWLAPRWDSSGAPAAVHCVCIHAAAPGGIPPDPPRSGPVLRWGWGLTTHPPATSPTLGIWLGPDRPRNGRPFFLPSSLIRPLSLPTLVAVTFLPLATPRGALPLHPGFFHSGEHQNAGCLPAEGLFPPRCDVVASPTVLRYLSGPPAAPPRSSGVVPFDSPYNPW